MSIEWCDEIYDTLYEGVFYYDNFNNLPEKVQRDLIEWFNVRDPDKNDKELMFKLVETNNFTAWNCPLCEDQGKMTRVFNGDIDAAELNWNDFQMVLNQDFSFFGNREKYNENYIDRMCDHCRCYG